MSSAALGNIRSIAFVIVMIATSMSIGLSAGCKAGNKKKPRPQPTSMPTPEETWTEAPITTPPQSQLAMPVVQGAPPLVYLVEVAQMVRIVNLDKNNEELLKVPVSARTLVAVTTSGIKVGGVTMKLGPLPAEHRYAIYLESAETNTVRRGTVRPGRPRPTTTPGGAQ